MDPFMKETIEELESLGYTCSRHRMLCSRDFCYHLNPPVFPQKGVDNREQQFENLKKDFEKVGPFEHLDYHIKIRPKKYIEFKFLIEKPSAKSEPEDTQALFECS